MTKCIGQRSLPITKRLIGVESLNEKRNRLRWVELKMAAYCHLQSRMEFPHLTRLRPVPYALAALGLAQCTGLPCFRGVTPGLTRWSEVRAAWASLPNSQLNES